jgi:hypothetical protein
LSLNVDLDVMVFEQHWFSVRTRDVLEPLDV